MEVIKIVAMALVSILIIMLFLFIDAKLKALDEKVDSINGILIQMRGTGFIGESLK